MSTLTTTRLPLHSLLFHYIDADQLSHSVNEVLAEETTSSYMLLVIKSGSGRLYTEAFSSSFSQGSTYLLSPAIAYQFESIDDCNIEYYRVFFRVFQVNEGAAAAYYQQLFPERNELRIYPQAQWTDLLNQLYVGRTNRNELEAHRQQSHFQHMISFLLEHNFQADVMPSSAQTVEQTVQYMQTNYQTTITVKQLAQMANIPTWQFTSVFKELTGKKPLDFLTEVRINHAKEWLTHTENTLREIAERVGFADEYYFSRRFRLLTGFSPRQYANSMNLNIIVKDWNGHEVQIPSKPSRVLYCGETTGDMAILDIPLIEKHFFSKETPLCKEQAAKLSPDLIIFDYHDESLYAQVSQIAPTLTYNSRGALSDRLLMLGEWFGKKKEAQQWLLHHNRNMLLMWQRLRAYLRPDETASVIVFHRGKRLFVMGNIGLSSILYHPHGFRPAGKVQQMMNSGRPYKEITAKTIHHYAGDRVFMMLPESPESKEAMNELMSSPLWRNLPAVKNGYSYLLDERDWNYEDATTRDTLLSLLPQLLTQSS
ncbi:helix-turn-helix domain-containing protein [Paenibacillus sinopodophylli]|uniref:helix-turn-helix domain-containing protein n=1 Tax=Paenibacillus sinopodophylli TaxID=1837342 RepID=UPI00110CA85A|nr:helix-turn-helix domain-containing protein [Paenibacillus sinopodophylli]